MKRLAAPVAAVSLALVGTFVAASPAYADTSVVSTPYENSLVETDVRSGGAYEYVAGGLTITMSDAVNTSNNKVQLAFPGPTDFPFEDIGELDVTATGTGYPYGPGLNLWIDLNGDATPEGTLVFEEVYGQDFWVPDTPANTALKALAPSNTGGNGSAYHGTLAQWLDAFEAAEVTATVLGVALNHGSGIPVSEWTVTSVTFADHTYTFDNMEPEPEPSESPSASPSPSPTPTAGGSLANTGTSLTGIIAVGVVIVIAGVVLVAFATRRRTR